VPELPLVQAIERPVEAPEQGQAVRRDGRPDDPPILLLARPSDQAPLLEAIEQPDRGG
jgi:hypothetical protein